MVAVDDPLVLVADWLVAAALIGGAAVTWRRDRAPSVLLALAGGTWLLGGVTDLALFWHRAVLVHLLLAHPGWRPSSRPATAVVVAAYAVCVLFPVVLATEAGSWASAVVVPAVAAWNVRNTTGVLRHLRRSALLASLLLAGGLLVGSLVRSAGGTALTGVGVLVHDAAVVLVVVVLAAGLRPPHPAELTDLVVDLGEDRSAPLRDALAATLHDPDLRLGYWDPAAGAHLDHVGRPLPDTPPPGRAVLPLDRDGRPFARLLLDARLAADPEVVEAVRVATRMVELHDRRQADVQARLDELRASRRRLLMVGDDERRRLEAELSAGIVARLLGLTSDLDELDGLDTSDPRGRPLHLVRAREQLERTVEDLHEVATGLRPRELAAGLPRALACLADRSPSGVDVHGADAACADGLPGEVELAAWYLCTEALANVAKHAPGARVTISLTRTRAALVVRVADDGPGGAVPSVRGGLVGLRDRVEALGGRLAVASSPTGTTLEGELPLS